MIHSIMAVLFCVALVCLVVFTDFNIASFNDIRWPLAALYLYLIIFSLGKTVTKHHLPKPEIIVLVGYLVFNILAYTLNSAIPSTMDIIVIGLITGILFYLILRPLLNQDGTANKESD